MMAFCLNNYEIKALSTGAVTALHPRFISQDVTLPPLLSSHPHLRSHPQSQSQRLSHDDEDGDSDAVSNTRTRNNSTPTTITTSDTRTRTTSLPPRVNPVPAAAAVAVTVTPTKPVLAAAATARARQVENTYEDNLTSALINGLPLTPMQEIIMMENLQLKSKTKKEFEDKKMELFSSSHDKKTVGSHENQEMHVRLSKNIQKHQMNTALRLSISHIPTLKSRLLKSASQSQPQPQGNRSSNGSSASTNKCLQEKDREDKVIGSKVVVVNEDDDDVTVNANDFGYASEEFTMLGYGLS